MASVLLSLRAALKSTPHDNGSPLPFDMSDLAAAGIAEPASIAGDFQPLPALPVPIVFDDHGPRIRVTSLQPGVSA
jgi:hypothetical protein